MSSSSNRQQHLKLLQNQRGYHHNLIVVRTSLNLHWCLLVLLIELPADKEKASMGTVT